MGMEQNLQLVQGMEEHVMWEDGYPRGKAEPKEPEGVTHGETSA